MTRRTVGTGWAGEASGSIPHDCGRMIDREKVVTVLRRRFPGAPVDQVAAAANAIMGLGDEWQTVETNDLADLLERLRHGHEFRLLERKEPDA